MCGSSVAQLFPNTRNADIPNRAGVKEGRGWVTIALALEELRPWEVETLGSWVPPVRLWAQQFQFAIGLLQ